MLFRLPDPGRLAGVRLHQEVRIPGERLDFAHDGREWTLSVDRPAVNRMEYLFELRHGNGGRETILDPGNPLRVAGVFGDKSVVEFPEYAAPAWRAADASPGTTRMVELPDLTVTLWSPEHSTDDQPLPLLVVNDGPEYDSLAMLTRYLAAGITGGWLPPLRAALLHPGDRNDRYSANAAYADALPALLALPATVRVGMGTSLGALATLHAQRRHPALFDALFLQSGSFFHPRHDEHERRFSRYERIAAFVEEVMRNPAARAVPAVLTCGAIEENIHNNRMMADTLSIQGYSVLFRELADVHNYTAWRDAFDPHLTRLLQDVCT